MRLELCGSILFQVILHFFFALKQHFWVHFISYIVENVCILLAKMNFESYKLLKAVRPTLC